jgi:hypothetical protein
MQLPTATAGQPTINAELLALVLVARKARPSARWAAMSTGADTAMCKQRHGVRSYLLRKPSLLSPMDRGHMLRVVDRTRYTHGLAEVRATWGCGLRGLRAEVASHIMTVAS